MVGVIRAWDAGYQPPRMPKYSPKRYSVGVDLGQTAREKALRHPIFLILIELGGSSHQSLSCNWAES